MNGLTNAFGREGILVAFLVATALAAAGYTATRGSAAPSLPSAITSQSAAPNVPPAPRDTLRWLVAGFPRPLGGTIPLTGDISAEISESGSGHADRQLHMILRRGPGQAPVDGARITAEGGMPDMIDDHFRVAGTALGDGEYVVLVPVTMAGEWDVVLTIATPEAGTGTLQLAIDVVD